MAAQQAYSYDVVKGFTFSALLWGVVTVVLGILISTQLVYPDLNFAPYLTFGRIRPVHTNAGAFGFALGGIFALFYYMTMKLTKSNLVFPKLARAHLWIFNVAIVLAAVTLLMGMNTTKEYAELEWPLDIVVVIFWVMFAVNILGTIMKRKELHLYVSLWYIIVTTIGVAVLYIVNNLAIPAGMFKSYSVFSGVNDANVQWWYGHNAVAFVFTTPILAMFYYFFPKSVNLPIYSHRLSMVAFWSLIFAYLWTGAHHLVYTPVPDWIQTVSIAFTIFLIAPSWGSVINGYYTMNGNWDRMRTNYLVKFFILGITFYGLQTVQGPSQGLRTVSALIHYTDTVPGHVHMGTMGWVTMTICASIYYMLPKLYNTEIYSIKLANVHFWLVLIGQLMYSVTMWITGIQQGAMWRATDPDGSLTYTFIETNLANIQYWNLRTIAGIIFLAGFLVFTYNVIMTARNGKQLRRQEV
ncbi:MAG: cbb3-type cytochrome c oxidase subunit I [Desulfobulbaceae bacterium]|nr:cbb3-type cytochrome c oxidase subunit I [Desulfobulbaceae bacterium]